MSSSPRFRRRFGKSLAGVDEARVETLLATMASSNPIQESDFGSDMAYECECECEQRRGEACQERWNFWSTSPG